MSKKFNVSKDETMKNIINEFSLTEDKAQEYIRKYWQKNLKSLYDIYFNIIKAF